MFLLLSQLQNIITALEGFLLTVEDMENCLRHPRPYLWCYHGAPQPQCVHTTADHFCPTTDAIKYKMVRVSVDGLSLNLVESGTILNVQVSALCLAQLCVNSALSPVISLLVLREWWILNLDLYVCSWELLSFWVTMIKLKSEKISCQLDAYVPSYVSQMPFGIKYTRS